MDFIIDEYIKKEIRNKYMNDKEMIEKSITEYELHFLNKYKKEHPLRLLSFYYLKRFQNKLRNLELLPSEDKYEEISRKNEFFDANMYLPIRIGKQDYILQFPMIVNVSELSRYIERQNLNKVPFNIDELLSIMTEGYQDDYEIDNKIRTEKRDILYDERKRNPIIIMKGSKATSHTIINGNHRIMYYSKIRQNNVEGYYISSEECCKFALTRDYEILYNMIINLVNKFKKAMM